MGWENSGEHHEPLVYGLKKKGRLCVSSESFSHEEETSREDTSRFWLATNEIQQTNEIHRLDYQDQTNKISSKIYSFDRYIVGLVPFSRDPNRLCITSRKEEDWKTSIYRLPDASETHSGGTVTNALHEIVKVETTKLSRRAVLLPDREDQLLLVHDTSVTLWDMNTSTLQLSQELHLPKDRKAYTATWDLHSPFQFVITSSADLFVYDTRDSKSYSLKIEFADEIFVRSSECNPNRSHRWMTAGDDGHLRFWDLRQKAKKLMEIEAHSHWIWNANYNPFHDQLCLSCSSDSKVKLWNLGSLSSAEPMEFLGESELNHETRHPIPDGLVHSYEQHEESVYSVAWSKTDPWTFASLSYDGRVVIDHVMEDIKYKILL